jgi:hypothetical protein
VQPDQAEPRQNQQPIALASVPTPEPSPRDARPKPAATPVALRGTNTDLAAKPRVTTAEPREVAKALAPARAPAATRPAEPDLRTAYSTATIAGAQPAMPAGSFDSRWSGLR